MDKQRFGRKSFYDDATVRAVVQKWEQIYSSTPDQRLADFLEQEFGTNEDGSPKITRDTFYGWRRRIIKNSEN